jgi:tetratricopeptide (TPR) repeat protein
MPAYSTPLASVVVTVTDENGNPLNEQALVKLAGENTSTNTWATTQRRSRIEFDSVAPGEYEIEASAAGFQATTQTLDIPTAHHEVFDVVVRLKLDTTGNATDITPGQVLAPKAQKETQKGVAALKLGNLNDAQKHLEAAFQLAPTNADVAFLLGYAYLQEKDKIQAITYFQKAASFNPKHTRALTSLGQVYLDQGEYKNATDPLEKAIGVDPDHWQAHWILATAYLHLNELEKSAQQAELAIKTGKGAAKDAELVLGNALAGMGKSKEAIEAYRIFLEANPDSSVDGAVRDVIAKLEAPAKPEATSQPVAAIVSAASASRLADPVSPDANLSLPRWAPPNVDEEKPVIAAGTRCPVDHVVEQAGERVKELVDGLSNFDATEDVTHEVIGSTGKPAERETRKFDYTVTIAEPLRDVLRVEEFRNGLNDKGGFPGGIATHGLPALAFVFHPDRRDDFDMVCEGLGSWNGQATWLVHFRQRPDKPSREQSFDFNDASVTVDLKGRAWISASDYQIVRLEADLINPLRSIQLFTEHQIVEYQPVKFTKLNTVVWLPANADIYMDFRRQRFHRRHSFSHYQLFSVGTSQKISQPKMPDATQEAPKQPN